MNLTVHVVLFYFILVHFALLSAVLADTLLLLFLEFFNEKVVDVPKKGLTRSKYTRNMMDEWIVRLKKNEWMDGWMRRNAKDGWMKDRSVEEIIVPFDRLKRPENLRLI